MVDRILDIYKDFGQMTTMHGVKRTAHSNPTWLKLLWTLFVFTGIAWATYQIVLTVQSYYSFPSSTQLSIETNHTLELPAVTICNLNRLRVSKATFLQPQFDAWRQNNLAVAEQMKELNIALTDVTREVKESLGHSMSDMMLSCTFDEDDCSPANFTLDVFLTNGNCFTLGDRTANPSASRYVSQAGPANGLILELDIEQDEYLPITESAGIKVLLHSGSEIVFPDNSGILAAPGFVTSIGIRRSESYLLPKYFSYSSLRATYYQNISLIPVSELPTTKKFLLF
ncbi:acid-sensing ion channel 1A-like [Physella acuta]|uniref:acid-sensing ion channel 1A-like n=1 Tax=Physella acuta TaxID=109671 RepID=UPI0027DD617E|nr:acid-sensing ion channel 1A-like [Physella acuta]